MRYAIAYKDKDGMDFGGLPFIIDEFCSLGNCYQKQTEMEADEYKYVLCFKIENESPEELTWEYVFKNVVEPVEKYGLCKCCECFTPEHKWPMQCWYRGMLHPYTCSDFYPKWLRDVE